VVFSLDLNGHRLEASGTFRIESGGALKSTNGGLLVTASDTKILGSAEGMNEKDVNLIAVVELTIGETEQQTVATLGVDTC
jgi:hypothetical protein